MEGLALIVILLVMSVTVVMAGVAKLMEMVKKYRLSH